MIRNGYEKLRVGGTFPTALAALGRLGLSAPAETDRGRAWSDRRRMLDSPTFKHLFYCVGDEIQSAMLGSGMNAESMMSAHARAMAALYACAGEALPVDGLSDDQLLALGLKVESCETQTNEFRLIEVPEGWKMVLGDNELDDDTCSAYVVDRDGCIRLDLAFTTGPDGRAHGTVSERPLPELITSEI